MGKGGVDHYIRAQLEKHWHMDTTAKFEDIAKRVFWEISPEKLGLLMSFTSAEGSFAGLHQLTGRPVLRGDSAWFKAQDLIEALFVDICRIYAMKDRQLRAKLEAEAAAATG